MFLLPTLIILFFIGFIYGCRPVCRKIEMSKGIVPNTYNKCLCTPTDNSEDYDYFFGAAVAPCSGQYRSLKFRNSSSGHVVLHKAVIKACLSKSGVSRVNQTAFESQEREYLYKRNVRKHVKVSSISNWLLGIRSNFLRLNLEHHLRFG